MHKKIFLLLAMILVMQWQPVTARAVQQNNDFAIKGFHLDLRIQVMTMSALKEFALKLSRSGINTLIMEWEGTYPFSKHPLIPNRYAYTKEEIVSFVKYCGSLGIDVIPLQQSFGHVEYILRHYRYAKLREDQKDYSQVCPSQEKLDEALFTDLFTEMASTHPSKYFHIGGDETYLLGHCPLCKKKAAEEGISKLYIDHIRMLCNIVTKLGKRPVLWADIAIKYPEALKLLPKETIFVDWNYGWEMNRFGDHQKLLNSGFEIWGAAGMRSHPDNYFLTQWEKHFNNIRDFIPAARKMGYKGMIMTSWSTSGGYDVVQETNSNIIDLYAIRHVYPITGFSILVDAYTEALKSPGPLAVQSFVEQYCKENYGFDKSQADAFWSALKTAPYEVQQGEVIAHPPLSIKSLLDSAKMAANTFAALQPAKNPAEFEQYRLMADIRVQYLSYEEIEKEVNAESFSPDQSPGILARLKEMMDKAAELDKRFIALNKDYFFAAELEQENKLRDIKTQLLYDRLLKKN